MSIPAREGFGLSAVHCLSIEFCRNFQVDASFDISNQGRTFDAQSIRHRMCGNYAVRRTCSFHPYANTNMSVHVSEGENGVCCGISAVYAAKLAPIAIKALRRTKWTSLIDIKRL